MTKYYAGIGSRETPPDILELMVKLGRYMAEGGWVLRSGGAEGADTAFEQGCDEVQGKKEIFLPWKEYNGNKSNLYYNNFEIPNEIRDKSFELARLYHPAWDQCTYGAKALLARDGLQILGKDLKTPVSMVLFWSPDPNRGGTSQAIRISADYEIVYFNLGDRIERGIIINKMDRGADFLGETSHNLFE